MRQSRRLFETRKKEHRSKVRLTNEDVRTGPLGAAEERMGKEDSGLARHNIDCKSEIDWEEARVVACEYGLRQKKSKGRDRVTKRKNMMENSIK